MTGELYHGEFESMKHNGRIDACVKSKKRRDLKMIEDNYTVMEFNGEELLKYANNPDRYFLYLIIPHDEVCYKCTFTFQNINDMKFSDVAKYLGRVKCIVISEDEEEEYESRDKE